MQVTETGSVRVDLVGGTIDLEPINLIIPNVVTLNVATSLKAKVTLEKIDSEVIQIISEDYNKEYSYNLSDLTEDKLYFSDEFKEMAFILQLIDSFGVDTGLKVTLASGAPAGSGLGGSSAMGVTLYKALCKLSNKRIDINEAVSFVKATEGRILNRGVAGYQDYFPALTGGVLSIKGTPHGIKTEQLFSEELKAFLEDHITLVYSGITRNSGINNWDVYKGFFDKNETIRSSLGEIADISFKALTHIKKKQFNKMLELIGLEGDQRESLAAGIVPIEVSNLYGSLKSKGLVSGLKMCGAGGGGCFILTHDKSDKEHLKKILESAKYRVLDFIIEEPLQTDA